jgi:hypothetical protein
LEDEECLWGSIDVDEYEHYNDPLNGDMHEVVPDKLIAFVGPQDLGGEHYRDDERGRVVRRGALFPRRRHRERLRLHGRPQRRQ